MTTEGRPTVSAPPLDLAALRALAENPLANRREIVAVFPALLSEIESLRGVERASTATTLRPNPTERSR